MSLSRIVAVLLLMLVPLLISCGGGGSSGGTSRSDTTTDSPEPAPPANDPPVNNPNASYRMEPLVYPDGTPVAEATAFVESGSSGKRLNGQGEVLGTDGYSRPWVYRNGAAQALLGWSDFKGAPPEVYPSNAAVAINESGQVLGSTTHSWNELPPGCDNFGCINYFSHSRAWLYRDGSYVGLGRVGPALNADVVNVSPFAMNEAGQATGVTSWSRETTEGLIEGSYAWRYANAVNEVIGLEGGTVSANWIWNINEAGDVIGVNVRGTSGRDCWLYSEGTTYPIVVPDDEQSSTGSGQTDCDVLRLNERAQVVGQFTHSGEGGNGSAMGAWLYSEGKTVRIGLLGNEDANSIATQSNIAEILNDAGQVVGRTVWAGDRVSQVVWLYDKSQTREIGLTDPEHTGIGGHRYSNLSNNRTALNSAGQVMGYSDRYPLRNYDFGRTAWLYSDGKHTRLGLEGDGYTAANGYRYSEAVALNNAGQVAGYSRLYLLGDEYPGCYPGFDVDDPCLPRTAWLYDSPTGEMLPLTFSSRSDGYEYSDVFHLSESGIATGYYQAFDAEDDSYEWRMFQFSRKEGLRDIVIDGMESLSPSPPILTHQSGHFVGWFGVHVNGEGLEPSLLSPLP